MPLFHRDGTAPTDPNAVFVFGSNLLGAHAGGAARVAQDAFGAEDGLAEGPAGRSYAIPTLGRHGGQLPLSDIAASASAFLRYAQANPGTTFFVTRIGCGIAGFRNEEIAPMFRGAPENCSFAEGWREWL